MTNLMIISKKPVVAKSETFYLWPANVAKLKEAVCKVNSYMDVCNNNNNNKS
jgi:hypothetical protein